MPRNASLMVVRKPLSHSFPKCNCKLSASMCNWLLLAVLFGSSITQIRLSEIRSLLGISRLFSFQSRRSSCQRPRGALVRAMFGLVVSGANNTRARLTASKPERRSRSDGTESCGTDRP